VNFRQQGFGELGREEEDNLVWRWNPNNSYKV